MTGAEFQRPGSYGGFAAVGDHTTGPVTGVAGAVPLPAALGLQPFGIRLLPLQVSQCLPQVGSGPVVEPLDALPWVGDLWVAQGTLDPRVHRVRGDGVPEQEREHDEQNHTEIARAHLDRSPGWARDGRARSAGSPATTHFCG